LCGQREITFDGNVVGFKVGVYISSNRGRKFLLPSLVSYEFYRFHVLSMSLAINPKLEQ
jgi:hypothetical protein